MIFIIKKILEKLGIHSKGDLAAFIIQFLKFGAVGISNTAITLAAQYGLMALGMHYIPAYAIAFFVSVANSFFWNGKFVFKNAGSPGALGRFFRMLAASGFTLLAGMGFMALLVEALHISESIAPLLNLLLTVPLNFLLTKFWAFKA